MVIKVLNILVSVVNIVQWNNITAFVARYVVALQFIVIAVVCLFCSEPDDAVREKRDQYHPNIVFTEADQRPSAQGVGTVVVVIVVLELGFLVILDGVRIIQALERWNLIRRGR